MLIERVKSILFQPKETWPKIKAETTNFGQVLTGYAIPMTLIPAIFGFLGYVLIALNRFDVVPTGSGIFAKITFLWPEIFFFLVWAIFWYILFIAGLYIEGIIINAFAPFFGSKQNSLNAFKLAVYAYTPAFIAGILRIIPALGIVFFILSLYGIYLLYLGLPIMMETPKKKAVVYIIVIFITWVAIYAIIIPSISRIVLPTTEMNSILDLSL